MQPPTGDPDLDLAWFDAVARLAPGDWVRLDRSGRQGRALSGSGPAIVAWDSFHRDGRVRERAVHALARSLDSRVVGFLVLRIDDWVPQVREAARAAVIARLRADADGRWAWAPLLVLRDRRVRGAGLLDACVDDAAARVLVDDRPPSRARPAIRGGRDAGRLPVRTRATGAPLRGTKQEWVARLRTLFEELQQAAPPSATFPYDALGPWVDVVRARPHAPTWLPTPEWLLGDAAWAQRAP